MIGVNSRDLKTFKVDLNVTLRLAQMLPLGIVAVAESGIETGADISQLRAAGYNGFLIGETLMRAPRPGEVLKALLHDANAVAAGGSR
jgi:indole-3-glycerol phosphate synthase